MFELRIENNKAWVTNRETLTTYSEGYEAVQIRPDFGPEWNNLSKIAVFRAYDAQIDIAMTDTTVEVPLQVLLKPNVHLMFGIYGISATGAVVIPTVWADLGIIQAGVNPTAADNYSKPAMDLYAQVYTLVEQAEQAAADAATAQYAGSVSFTIDGVTVDPEQEDTTGHLIVSATSGGVTVETDLGAVTAYAAAKEGGYTGTYDQFKQLLLSVQTAANAATTAASAASAAATAAAAAKEAADDVVETAEEAYTMANSAENDAHDAIAGLATKQAQHKTATVLLESGQTTWGKSVTGVTATNLVLWGPSPASFDAAQEFGVRMTEQAAGSVTFTATAATDTAITMNLAIFD